MVLRPDFIKRLEAVETRIAGQPPEGPSGPSLWRLMLLLVAVYEGQHEGSESMMCALSRALKFDRPKDLEAALREPSAAAFNERYAPALERLLRRAGLTIETATGPALHRFLQIAVDGVPPSSRWLLVRGGYADE